MAPRSDRARQKQSPFVKLNALLKGETSGSKYRRLDEGEEESGEGNREKGIPVPLCVFECFTYDLVRWSCEWDVDDLICTTISVVKRAISLSLL